MYDAWLLQGDKFKKKYYAVQWLALGLWALMFAAVRFFWGTSMVSAIAIGLIPAFICYLYSFGYYDKWQECERNYSSHVPFVDVKKMNVLINSLEFSEGHVLCSYFTAEGRLDSIDLPSEKVSLLPSEDGSDSLQLRKDIHNYDQTIEWIYIRIYLTPVMQEQILSLCH